MAQPDGRIRGQAIAQCGKTGGKTGGAMAAATAGEEVVQSLLEGDSVVISGSRTAIQMGAFTDSTIFSIPTRTGLT